MCSTRATYVIALPLYYGIPRPTYGYGDQPTYLSFRSHHDPSNVTIKIGSIFQILPASKQSSSVWLVEYKILQNYMHARTPHVRTSHRYHRRCLDGLDQTWVTIKPYPYDQHTDACNMLFAYLTCLTREGLTPSSYRGTNLEWY